MLLQTSCQPWPRRRRSRRKRRRRLAGCGTCYLTCLANDSSKLIRVAVEGHFCHLGSRVFMEESELEANKLPKPDEG